MSAAPFRRPAVLLFGALLTLCGCATAAGPASPATAPAAGAVAATRSDRQETINHAIEEVLLAREQARLGLMDEAQQAWDRAVAILAPLAQTDPQVAEQSRQIEAERDRAVRESEIRAEIDSDDDATETAASGEILESPEPQLDKTLLSEVGKAAQGITADYPLVLNDQVYAWLEAWTHGLRGVMSGGIERSGMYVERARQIFAQEGVPQDLVYLAHVESSFKTSAYSPAAARGIYQFIAETGRRYGLVTNWWLDERADPEKSARASAAYLRDLYAEFGDWYLALASYNCGENFVRKVVARTNSKDFFDPANLRQFPLATRNYVPAIIAATIVAKDPKRFGFDVTPAPALQFETVVVPSSTSLSVLATVAGTDPESLRQLNPALRRQVTPPAYKDFVLKVPVGAAEGFADRLAAVPADQRIAPVEHVVRRGESLAWIARQHGVSSRALAEANQLGRRPRIYAGMVLVVPQGPDAAAAAADAAPQQRAQAPRNAAQRAVNGVYTVRRGDQIGGVARRFGVRVSDIQKWNGMGRSIKLVAGRELRVAPPAGGKSRPAPQEQLALKGRAAAAPADPKAPQAPKVARRSAQPRAHVVKRGESLASISRIYGVAAADIAAANRLGKGWRIVAGQRLVIPARTAEVQSDRERAADGSVHVVKRGETLAGVARQHGLSVRELCRINGMPQDTVIYPGEALTVAQ